MNNYMKLSLATTLLLPILPVQQVAAQEQRPNVIVFLVDDMGLMDTSLPFLCDEAGNPVRYPLNDWYRTPNMERLAEQGIRFSLCPEREFALAGFDYDGTECGASPDDQLD